MQFLAYQARGVGGFLLGTEDAGRALKWFDVAGDGEHLRMSFTHKAPALVAGASFVPAYPVVIARARWRPLDRRRRSLPLLGARPAVGAGRVRGRAGCARRWASAPSGCRRATTGAPGCGRWAAAAGVPVFHVLGPDWAARGHDYTGQHPARPAGLVPGRVPPREPARHRGPRRVAGHPSSSTC